MRRVVIIVTLLVCASSVWAGDCVTNARGRTVCSNGETAAVWDSVGKGKGRVRWFAHGYGFIESEHGEEIFVHFTGIPGQGERTLPPGAMVEFDIVEGPRGRHAVQVRLLNSERSSVSNREGS